MDIDSQHAITCLNINQLESLESALRARGYRIYVLDGKTIDDKRSFFAQVKRVLPMDPPLGDGLVWDGFTDSLWSGLDALGEPKVSVIWNNVERMLDHGLPDLLVAYDCFLNVIRQVADPTTRIRKTVHLRLYLLGNGANFI